ncbi:glycosyl transferase, partial [Myxococcota bacterium]|nr:glycosyl transferase [Myxococcota bacterium]
RIPPRPTRPPEAIHALLSFDPPASLGPQISTHLDLALQRDLQASLQAQLEGWRADGAGNGALIVVERPSSLDPEAPDGAGRWRLRALIGSADYHAARDHGAIDFTRALRLPGSTLKPFLYAHALEQGALRPTQVMDDLQRARGGVTNADRRFLGPLLPRVALANSRNVPAVELMMRVGLPGFFRLLGELGLHDGEADPRRYGEGLAIGGMPTRLIDLARAYTALAGDGRLASLSRFLGEPLPPARRIFSEGVARRVTLMLSDPMARLPTFPRMGHGELPFAAAIKTGTSSSYRDALAVGWSERYLVLAWVGRPDGQPTRGLSGYRAGAALVGATLRRLHPQARDGVSEGGFPAPEGSQPVSLCALSGQRATSACPSRIIEPLLPQEVPHADCAWHTRDDARGGVSLHLPPRYMAWANERGLPAHAREAPWGPQDEIKVELLTPRPNLRLRLDPDAPAALSTLKLQATVEPPVEQVVFYVDGRPFAVVDPPYTARWPLRPGAHVIEARLPFSDLRSTPVQLIVH